MSDKNKVSVIVQEPFYLLTYKNDEAAAVCDNVYLYIDIPAIDYQIHNKATTINSQLESSLLKNLPKEVTSGVYIHSSGSLRYVKTISNILQKTRSDALRFYIDVTPASYKWFKTYLPHDMKQQVTFNTIVPVSSPFKDYYTKLNDSFSSKKTSTTKDTICVITNKNGVRALLTILSDYPLSQLSSIKDPKNSSSKETALKRESSSLLSFQKNILTSNKDRSIKPHDLKKTHQPDNASPSSSSDGSEGDDDEGITFNVPSKLIPSEENTLGHEAPALRKNRFRSLSLMDPYYSPTNIYIHDGEFGDGANNSRTISAASADHNNSRKRNNSSNASTGLIPPEFYSRLSSPSSSNNSSNNSLLNHFSLAPGLSSNTSKALNENSTTTPTNSTGNFRLFEKNLIHKSLEEMREQQNNMLASPSALFNTLVAGIPRGEYSLKESDGEEPLNQHFTLNFGHDCEDNSTKETRDQVVENPHLSLYDDMHNDEHDSNNTVTKDNEKTMNNATAKPYKKTFTVDLYGDDDTNNGGFTNWVLGGNK